MPVAIDLVRQILRQNPFLGKRMSRHAERLVCKESAVADDAAASLCPREFERARSFR